MYCCCKQRLSIDLWTHLSSTKKWSCLLVICLNVTWLFLSSIHPHFTLVRKLDGWDLIPEFFLNHLEKLQPELFLAGGSVTGPVTLIWTGQHFLIKKSTKENPNLVPSRPRQWINLIDRYSTLPSSKVFFWKNLLFLNFYNWLFHRWTCESNHLDM